MRSATDGRQQLLTLTRKGQTIFAPLDSRAREDVAALLGPLSDAEQRRLIDAMRAIERLPLTVRDKLLRRISHALSALL
jgi:DNA-binding MarR family transcriptional regulator